MISEKKLPGYKASGIDGAIDKDKELKSKLDFTKTTTDHIAVWIIKVFGSMRFLIGCLAFFFVWIFWNVKILPFVKPFDPFPFST